MLKQASKIMFIAMLVFSLVGSFTAAFAGGPPENKAGKNQSCHASAQGKANANTTHSVVSAGCSGSFSEGGEGEGGGGNTTPPDTTDPCLDPAYFFSNLGECAV